MAQHDEIAVGGYQRIYVWDLVVRVTHWLIAGSIVVLSVTGIYIGRPFIAVTGPASQHFVMGTMKAIHFWAAIVFTLAVLGRIVWMFTGPPHARWWNFLPAKRERAEGIRGTLAFYLFLKHRPPEFAGHNPVAGMAYAAVFAIYLVMILTGLGLYAPHADVGSPLRVFAVVLPLFGGAAGATWVHHVGMWLLIGFTVHHVYSAILVSFVEKNGEIDSIVSGYKWMKRRRGGD